MQNSTTLFQSSPEMLVDLLMIAIREELKQFKVEAPEQADELLTKKQVCQYLNVTPTTIWRWQKQGKIETYGIGKIRYYKKAEITNLLTKLKK
jgi:excisionase family DNA binding protein